MHRVDIRGCLVLRKKRTDIEQLEKTVPSDFLDEDLSFFTKDTTYLWEVATCLDDSGLNSSHGTVRALDYL